MLPFFRSFVWLLLLAGNARTVTAGPDSLCFYFASGQTALFIAHQKALDSLLYAEKDSRQPLQIWGSADEPGTSSQNQTIAQTRANGIKNYLLFSGVPASRIILCQVRENREKLGENSAQRKAVLAFGMALSGEAAKGPVLPAKKISVPSLADPQNLKPKDVIALHKLLFQNGTDDLLPASQPALEELFKVLEGNPKLKIRIVGHVCCGKSLDGMPDGSWGWDISRLRAAAVYNYLSSKGISKERLTYIGMGFSKPKFFPERTEEEQALNRRVEVVVTGVE